MTQQMLLEFGQIDGFCGEVAGQVGKQMPSLPLKLQLCSAEGTDGAKFGVGRTGPMQQIRLFCPGEGILLWQ